MLWNYGRAVVVFFGSGCLGFAIMWLTIEFTLANRDVAKLIRGLKGLTGVIGVILGAVVLGFFGKFSAPDRPLSPAFMGYPFGLVLAIWIFERERARNPFTFRRED